MINGEIILRKCYPDLDSDQYQPAGIDLKLGQVFEFSFEEDELYGISNSKKVLPEHIPIKEQETLLGTGWILEPHTSYILQVDTQIKIKEESAQFYLPRSSLLRMGLNVDTAFGDPGFNGYLSFLGENTTSNPLFLEKGVRFVQLIDVETYGNLIYQGSYQEE